MIKEGLIADRAVCRSSKSPFFIIVNKSQGFWWGFYQSVKLENDDPVSFGDNMSVTLTRFGTLVITRSSMLLPRVGFLLSFACQEVVVKGFNKG